jgi:hypothetical protein
MTPRCSPTRNGEISVLGCTACFEREFQPLLKEVIPTLRPLLGVVRVNDGLHFNPVLAGFVFFQAGHRAFYWSFSQFPSLESIVRH